MVRKAWNATYKGARKVVIGVLGATVLGVGIALIVLPGPALVVIPIGLAILSLEFAWARRWLRRVKESSQRVLNQIRTPSGETDRA